MPDLPGRAARYGRSPPPARPRPARESPGRHRAFERQTERCRSSFFDLLTPPGARSGRSKNDERQRVPLTAGSWSRSWSRSRSRSWSRSWSWWRSDRLPLMPPPKPELDRLLRAAAEVRKNAYAPYSGFQVGAAVLAGGRVFAACNVENSSFPLGVCAERNAVAMAVAAGEQRIDAVAVVGGGARPAAPCGGCRQVRSEE